MEISVDQDLILRTLEEHDARILFRLVDANRQYLREWLPWLDVNMETNDSISFIRHQKTRATRPEDRPLGILHQRRLCGVVGYNWIKDGSCGLGYWIAEDAQGKGIITRAAEALIQHAFSNMNLDTVEIHIADNNARSRRVAERLGLIPTRNEEKAERLYDRYVDHVVYEIKRNGPDHGDFATSRDSTRP